MLTKSGARLLDFGLARTGAATPSTLTATQPARLTSQGTIIGTFHYMAPEQIEGAEGDARTDVWSFGCVLYEMLTGARPFDGKTTASVIANILNAPVQAVRERRPGVSRALDHVVARCLEKDPDARWHSMADVAQELRWASRPDETAVVPPRPLWKQPAAYGVALLFAAGGFALSRFAAPPAAVVPADRSTMKLSFAAPAGLTLTPFGANGSLHFALSPDGSRIAYVAAASGRAPSLWVQRLDSRTPREIPGSTDAAAPFWSPDSQSIGFFSEGRLRRSGVDSEQSQVLATTAATAGGTWSGDVILIGNGFGPIMRVPAAGGQPTPVTTVDAAEGGHRWPQFLGDGKHFLYARSRASGVWIGALDSNASALLLESGSTGVAAGASHVLFVPSQSTTLQARELDVASRRVTGPARDVAEGVSYPAGSGFPPASVSSNGLLAYWDGTRVATALGWYERAGTVAHGLPAPEDPAYFAISPDGHRLAYLRRVAEGGGIWLMEKSGVTSRLTLSGRAAVRPVWSRDGSSLSFTAQGSAGIALARRTLTGGAGERVLGEVSVPGDIRADFYANDWSRDGRTALVSVSEVETGRDIMVFSADTGRTTPYVNTSAIEVQPRFSPDDGWVAYTSNETGRWEVFVDAFPRAGSRHQVSYGGGSQPIWRRDGTELFYAAADGKLMTVTVTPGSAGSPPLRAPLFATRMRPLYAPYPYTYDASPDGQRFLISEVRQGSGQVISIITDWRRR